MRTASGRFETQADSDHVNVAPAAGASYADSGAVIAADVDDDSGDSGVCDEDSDRGSDGDCDDADDDDNDDLKI